MVEPQLRINYDPSKPREEHEIHDFYPDFSPAACLPIIVVNDSTQIDKIQNNAANGAIKIKQSHSNITNKPVFRHLDEDEVISTQPMTKIPENILKLGYKSNAQLAKKTKRTNKLATEQDIVYQPYRRDDADVNEFQHNDFLFDNISKNQQNFKSIYDMDEQDHYFLQYYNCTTRKSFPPLSYELFEICMTILESEWFYLEKKIPPKLRSYDPNEQNNAKLERLIQFAKLYGSDDGLYLTHSQDEQRCAVCDESEATETNAIIFCDGCDIAVHQDCYGVTFIPEAQWHCRKCDIAKKKKLTCQFCPSHTGAFKQLSNGLWGHVICALWLPELYFASAGHMEPIEGIELIPKGRWRLSCYICKQKCGAPIQCINRSCFTAFHVTCAKRVGLYMRMSKGVQGAVLDKGTMKCYCDKHSPVGYNQIHEVKRGLERTKLYFSTVYHTHQHQHQHQHQHHHIHKNNDDDDRGPASKSSKSKGNKDDNKWKTNRGTPLAPDYFITILSKFLAKFKITDHASVSIQLVQYWVMKREHKRGAPLIRKNDHSYLYTGGGDPAEIPHKLQFSKTLIHDLERVELIAKDMVSKYENRYERGQVEETMLDIVYFTTNRAIRRVMRNVMAMESVKHYLIPLTIMKQSLSLIQIQEFAEKNYFLSFPQFFATINAYLEEVEALNNPTYNSAIRKIKNEVLTDALKDYYEREFEIDQEKLKSLVNCDGLDIDAVHSNMVLMMEEDLSEVEEPGQITFIEKIVNEERKTATTATRSRRFPTIKHAPNRDSPLICTNCQDTNPSEWRFSKKTGLRLCNACNQYERTHGKPRDITKLKITGKALHSKEKYERLKRLALSGEKVVVADIQLENEKNNNKEDEQQPSETDSLRRGYDERQQQQHEEEGGEREEKEIPPKYCSNCGTYNAKPDWKQYPFDQSIVCTPCRDYYQVNNAHRDITKERWYPSIVARGFKLNFHKVDPKPAVVRVVDGVADADADKIDKSGRKKSESERERMMEMWEQSKANPGSLRDLRRKANTPRKDDSAKEPPRKRRSARLISAVEEDANEVDNITMDDEADNRRHRNRKQSTTEEEHQEEEEEEEEEEEGPLPTARKRSNRLKEEQPTPSSTVKKPRGRKPFMYLITLGLADPLGNPLPGRKRAYLKAQREYEAERAKRAEEQVAQHQPQDEDDLDVEQKLKSKKRRGPGRPPGSLKKISKIQKVDVDDSVKRNRGRPRKTA